MPRSIAAALVALMVFPFAARADWALTTADFKDESRLTVNEFSLKGGASVNSAAGLRRVATKDLLVLTSDRPRTEPNSPWILTLRNGDVLYGMPADSDGESVTFTIAEGVDVGVPLKNITSLAQKGAKVNVATAAKDVVRLENRDTLQGTFLGIKEGQLTINTAGGDKKVDIKTLTYVTFAGVTPPRSIPSLSARLTFLSGSVVSASDVSWQVSEVTFKDANGTERKTGADQLSSLEILGGRTVFLTELDPAKDEQTSLFASKWPTQINRNVAGQPLRIAKQTFSRGIGVHTTSTLVYELDGTFNNLTLRAGLDDSSLPYGEADLAIKLDGKVLWQKKGAKGGELSDVLNLPIKGGKKLEFSATTAGKLDVQGRVNWVNVAMTR